MSDVQFVDRAPLSGVRRTSDGYLVAEARVARSGIQTYTRREVGLDGDGLVRVYRPEDEVFARDAVSTYAHRPVTIGHPSAPVTADTWKELAVGQTGEDVIRDGDTVRVPLVLMDADAIRAVEAGTRELSMGYTAALEMQDGTTPDGEAYDAVQRDLRMNHLAIVAEARGGPQLRIGDTIEEDAMADGDKRTVIVDGLSVVTTDAGAQAIEKLQRQIADAAAEHEKMIAAKDAEIATKDAKIAELEAQVLTDAQIDERVAERAALIDAAAKVAGAKINPAGMTNDAIRRAAITKRLGDAALEGKSDAYAEAMFDALSTGALAVPKSDPFADATAAGIQTNEPQAWGDSVFRSAGVRMRKEA